MIKRMKEHSPDSIFLCSVVKSELLAGAYKSKASKKILSRLIFFFEMFGSYPFDDTAADIYGKIRSELEIRGSIIGPYDLQIASIALSHNLTLVTNNTKEFKRISGLKVEDWEQ
ncbi:MAG TPA: type II toxin-antitoxin system VapC family toxin [Spirochaetota bacterium]|nr:type II toxin-antitoxin system VapC family toxin [Spirochaetota bacterium]HPR48842.1 type II toxin-antitoxin system VapC family toxin [Spirochaetota bacterium]